METVTAGAANAVEQKNVPNANQTDMEVVAA